MHVSRSQVYSAQQTCVYRRIRAGVPFLLCSPHNQDANLKDIAKHVSKVSLLLTGTYGSIWDTQKCFSNRVVLDAKLRRSDLGGHGMSEFRLVVGFIQLPFPYLGARRMSDILKITESSEMDPWRLGNLYDRPIARRLAEKLECPGNFLASPKRVLWLFFLRPQYRMVRHFGANSLTT